MDKYVEALNGYLDALGVMNNDANRSSDYKVVKFAEGLAMQEGLSAYHTALTDKYPPEYWHPQFTETTFDRVKAVAESWFFERAAVAGLPDKIKKNLLGGFHDRLIEMAGEFRVYELNTAPPVWYATRWDEFIFDSQYGVFLLHFDYDG